MKKSKAFNDLDNSCHGGNGSTGCGKKNTNDDIVNIGITIRQFGKPSAPGRDEVVKYTTSLEFLPLVELGQEYGIRRPACRRDNY